MEELSHSSYDVYILVFTSPARTICPIYRMSLYWTYFRSPDDPSFRLTCFRLYSFMIVVELAELVLTSTPNISMIFSWRLGSRWQLMFEHKAMPTHPTPKQLRSRLTYEPENRNEGDYLKHTVRPRGDGDVDDGLFLTGRCYSSYLCNHGFLTMSCTKHWLGLYPVSLLNV